MDRRRFLQMAGIAGLAFVAPTAERAVHADSRKYGGPYWILVNAAGGWDPTFFCDPKGGSATDPNAVDRNYTANQIQKAGNIRYAPVTGYAQTEPFYTTTQFFQAFHKRLLVVNGVDTTTNNHDVGMRTTWSGMMTDGFPSFGAVVASAALEHVSVPLAFLSNGGYDTTADVCPLSRLGSVNAVQRLAHTNVIDPNNPQSDTYLSTTTAARIAAAQQARAQALRDKQSLPALREATSNLFLARSTNTGLDTLAAEIATTSIVTLADFPDLAGLTNPGSIRGCEQLMQQAQIALLAFKAGVAVSASLNLGGFDTHANHDQDQAAALLQMLRALDYLLSTIDAMGLTSKVNVVVGSDFGRTPYYNTGNGKDHWNITSMMMAGPGIEGDRVVGATDGGFVAKNVTSTLKVGDAGERISTANIHAALRKKAGVTGTAVDQAYPLVGAALPFFG